MNVIKLDATLSTNSFLLDLSRKQVLPDKTIVRAALQTQGRGQFDTHWESQVGESLTFSVYKQFSAVKITRQPYLLFAVALGVREALSVILKQNCQIKWSNDIMAGNKKICGILIENQVKGNNLSSSVIGIGINVNQQSFLHLPKAGSLKQVSGTDYNLDEIFETVCKHLFDFLQLFESKHDERLKMLYEKHLFRKNMVTAFSLSNGTIFNAQVKGVNGFGQLLLEVESGKKESFNTKEITMLF